MSKLQRHKTDYPGVYYVMGTSVSTGKQEKIYATNGIGTGMKWLADKNDCLAIRPGEGFCR